MLQSLRSAAKTWVAKALFLALVAAFALWGVNDIFRAGVETAVAEVGNQDIPVAAYDRELRGQIRTMAQQSNIDLTMEQARALGIDRAVLDQMISRAALDEMMDKLGLTVSDEAVATQIRAMPEFKGVDGNFDRLTLQRALANAGLGEQAFIELIRRDMARAQLIGATADGATPSDGLTRLFFDYANEARTLDYFVVTERDAGEPAEPTDAELTAYHTANAERFSAPEYRAFEYVAFGPELVADEIAVTDADLQNEYTVHRASYEKPEQRDIQQITFPSKEEADAASARLAAGTDFAGLAQERGLGADDITLGTFTAAAIDPKLSQAAFALPEGGVSMPVEGPFGWVILRAARVVPGETRTFDDVKDDLRAGIVNARAAELLTDITNAFEDTRAGGASLADAAKQHGATVRTVAASDRMGMTPDGQKADVPAAPEFLEQVFTVADGEEGNLFQAGVSYYVVRVTAITPSALKPLDSVRADVREGALAEARAKALQAKAQALVEEANMTKSFAAATQSLGRQPMTSEPLTRTGAGETFSQDLLARLFSTPEGTAMAAPSPDGKDYIVARVTAVTRPEPDVNAPAYAQFRQGVVQQLAEDQTQTLAAAARQTAGVRINEATLQAALGETQP